MKNYHLIPMADEELVYLPVLLARPSSHRHEHALAHIPTLPTWLISLQEPIVQEET
jgi:hypothetical protein